MDIVIGSTPYVGNAAKKRKEGADTLIEARMLDMRFPRKPYGTPPNGQQDRRVKRNEPDPANSRIVTLLVPNGYSLPREALSGNLKILMRFVPDRQKIV